MGIYMRDKNVPPMVNAAARRAFCGVPAKPKSN